MNLYVSYAKNVGSSHLSTATPCQDCAFAKIENGSAVAIISDGAGSRKFAKETAEILVEGVVALFDRRLLDKYIDYGLMFNYLKEQLVDSGLDIAELGATLLFVYVKNNVYYCVHIGDGGVLLKQNDEYTLLSSPENGEYANETFFLPDSHVSHFRVVSGEISGDATFLLSSDGVFDIIYDTETSTPMPACDKLAECNIWEPESNGIIENSLKEVFSQYSSDDQSIAVLSVASEGK